MQHPAIRESDPPIGFQVENERCAYCDRPRAARPKITCGAAECMALALKARKQRAYRGRKAEVPAIGRAERITREEHADAVWKRLTGKELSGVI